MGQWLAGIQLPATIPQTAALTQAQTELTAGIIQAGQRTAQPQQRSAARAQQQGQKARAVQVQDQQAACMTGTHHRQGALMAQAQDAQPTPGWATLQTAAVMMVPRLLILGQTQAAAVQGPEYHHQLMITAAAVTSSALMAHIAQPQHGTQAQRAAQHWAEMTWCARVMKVE
jgi:hypothetical protein